METRDAFINMAIDEAVSEGVAAGTSPPTIRFYRWLPSAVSIGYFQSLNDEVNTKKCRELGVDWLRRRTGGGAVYHDYEGEITYSIIAPESEFPKDITKSYEVICGYLVSALGSLGISAAFKPVNDVVVGEKKISGSAQTRRNGVLLQHGTVLYSLDVPKMFSVLKVGADKISDKMIKSAEERVTCVTKQAQVGREQLADALVKAFTAGKECESGAWTKEELSRAEELAKSRYKTGAWNNMR